MFRRLGKLFVCSFTLTIALAMNAIGEGAVAIYNDKAVEIGDTLADPNDLWVSPEDLTRINGFVLKPEGACLDDICIPIRQTEDSSLFVTREGRKWVNITDLARKLQQPFTSDSEKHVWSFGQIPVTRTSFLESAMAPDFALEDRNGVVRKLSDYRGKKVLLITWASW